MRHQEPPQLILWASFLLGKKYSLLNLALSTGLQSTASNILFFDKLKKSMLMSLSAYPHTRNNSCTATSWVFEKCIKDIWRHIKHIMKVLYVLHYFLSHTWEGRLQDVICDVLLCLTVCSKDHSVSMCYTDSWPVHMCKHWNPNALQKHKAKKQQKLLKSIWMLKMSCGKGVKPFIQWMQ